MSIWLWFYIDVAKVEKINKNLYQHENNLVCRNRSLYLLHKSSRNHYGKIKFYWIKLHNGQYKRLPLRVSYTEDGLPVCLQSILEERHWTVLLMRTTITNKLLTLKMHGCYFQNVRTWRLFCNVTEVIGVDIRLIYDREGKFYLFLRHPQFFVTFFSPC